MHHSLSNWLSINSCSQVQEWSDTFSEFFFRGKCVNGYFAFVMLLTNDCWFFFFLVFVDAIPSNSSQKMDFQFLTFASLLFLMLFLPSIFMHSNKAITICFQGTTKEKQNEEVQKKQQQPNQKITSNNSIALETEIQVKLRTRRCN